MKRFFFILSLFATAILTSCGNNTPVDHSADVDLGKFDGNKYTCEEIGWSTEYPETWKITKKESLEHQTAKRDAEAEVEAKSTTIKRLLAYQKDFNNNFQSTIEPFEGKTKADYNSAKKNLRETSYSRYYDAGIRVDTVASQLKIGKITFDCFQINLYDKNAKAYAHQLLYSAIIKDYYFSAIIAYDNDKDKDRMLEAFKKSKFD